MPSLAAVALALALLGLAGCGPERTLYVGGPVLTMDADDRSVAALGVEGDRIAFVGGDAEGRRWAGGRARVDWTLTPDVDALIVNLGGNDLLRGIDPAASRANLDAILTAAGDRGLPVLFHDGTPPYSTTFQIAELARWCPNTTIILGHGGLADYVHAAAKLIRELPNLYACTCCPRAGDVLHLVRAGGGDKVVFGSDFGIADWSLLEDRLDDVLLAGLTPGEEQAVLRDNALRLLGRQ